ncbi:hypothetical protein [Streptomyces sp. NPDC006147]|uniref:hypothetical protein n=1 Tax=Streptomyces sp. NPDC006147 TaxID=3155597 RepID=UPI0033B03D79
MTDARAEFLANAKAYAARHPEDQVQARIIASLDPGWTPPVVIPPGRSLDLTAARARLASARTAPAAAPGVRRSSPPAERPRYAGTLDVGAVRRQREAEAAARRPPVSPPSALRFVADGSWRWSQVDASVPGARGWERLTAELVAAGPLRSLHVRHGDVIPGADGAHADFRYGEGGATWAEVVLRPGLRPHEAERLLAHELGHVADEVANLRSMTAAAWWGDFSDPHRSDQAEAFAVDCESWVRSSTRGEEIVTAALRHKAGRR